MGRFWFVVVWCVAAVGLAGGQDPKKEGAADAYFRQFKEPELAKELCVRAQSDQVVRKELIDFQAKHKLTGTAVPANPKVADEYKALVEKAMAEDGRNLTWLKEVVGKHGWPGKSLVGSLSAQNAWLLVQHADADRAFQKDCLKLMEAMPKGEVTPLHLAYLADRVLLADGKKQKYGTQAAFMDGKVVAAPIEDEGGVDERRKTIGLEPLADYLKMVEKMYAQPQKSDAKTGEGKR